MAWTSRFTDAFTEASDTWLTSHTPDSGSSWTLVDGPTDEGKVYAADDTLGHAFDSNLDARIYSADISGSWAAKQKAEAVAITNSTRRVAVRCGLTSTVGRCYEAYHNGGDNTVRCYRRDSPSSVTLLISDFDNTVDAADLIGIIADGSSISVEINGTPTSSSPVTDSTYSDGSPGATLRPTVTSGGLDDFEAFDESAGATLSPAGSTHGHSAGAAGFVQIHSLGTAAAAHGHSAESGAFVQLHDLALAGATHGHTGGQASFSIGGALGVASGLHSHAAGAATFAQEQVFAVQSAASAHLAAVVALAVQTEIIIADALHGHASTDAAFAVSAGVPAERLIIPGPPARTFAPGTDSRTLSGKR